METVDLDLDNAVWRKASLSSGNGGNCVEVASVTGTKDGQRQNLIAVRDSKNPSGPVLGFTRDEFAAFLDGANSGEFSDLV